MFSKIFRIIFLFCAFITKAHFFAHAQTGPVFPGAEKEKRIARKKELIDAVTNNLSVPLNRNNEDKWQSAFNIIILNKYEPAAIQKKISEAAAYLPKSSTDFKESWLLLVNSDFPLTYKKQVISVFKNAGKDEKLMAMTATYILRSALSSEINMMQQTVTTKLKKQSGNIILLELNEQLKAAKQQQPVPDLHSLFSETFLPGEIIIYSIQRRNRDYPGIVLIRRADGSFLKNDDGSFFTVNQLARSQGNMPYYISEGNTPQGIFRMDGFDTSKSSFIGPTTNIQLTMPFEYKASHFYRDSSLLDSVWTLFQYKKILPAPLQDYRPLYETYYAGKAGRNEIIAHGTAIDPSFYAGKAYYPFTPSAGCLSTAEFWNEENGRLGTSDQLLLANAVKKAGGAKGYLLVFDIDDKKETVQLSEVLKYLTK